jgi:hypothetical protein
MREIKLKSMIENIPDEQDLRFLLKKTHELNLYLSELDLVQIHDYRGMTYNCPALLFTGIIPDDIGRLAVISKRDNCYCLDWIESIRE